MKDNRPFARSILMFAASSLIVAGGATMTIAPARADNDHANCLNSLKHRTPQQTIEQHLAFLQAGNLDAAMCDYADDAKVVLPGQIVTGLPNIRAGLEQIGALLGGTIPTVQTLTPTDTLVLITFTALGTPCQIPDGSDTYVVDKGHITTQTVHDTFRSAPGASCPLAPPGN